MVHSLNKGKGFERWVANHLTEKIGVKFHRVPMSGGFATSFDTKAQEFQGDVFTEDDRYKNITIECKAHKELSITELFNPKSKLYDWIKQSTDEAKDNPWILFFKINNKGTYICYPKMIQVDLVAFITLTLRKATTFIEIDDKWSIRRLK